MSLEANRQGMKRLRTGLAGGLACLVLALIFQNCAGYESGYNPLTDGQTLSACTGSSCTLDINFIEILVSNSQPVGLLKPAAGTVPTFCDSATCFDLAGYCNAAGFPGSVFYYQWKLDNLPIGTRVSTGVACDSVGRFRILVQIPSPSIHTFNYSALYTVEVTMDVYDSTGAELESPTAGVATKSVPVMGVNVPTS